MRKILLTCAIVGLIGCSNSVGIDRSKYNQALQNCEQDIKVKLKSPSSMVISDIDAVFMEATPEDIYKWEYSNAYNKKEMEKIFTRLEENKYSPRKLGIIVKYEAQNSFGAMLSNEGLCVYQVVDNGNLRFASNEVSKIIDSKTLMDYFKKPSVKGEIKLTNGTELAKIDDKKIRNDAYVQALTNAKLAVKNAEKNVSYTEGEVKRAYRLNLSERWKKHVETEANNAKETYIDLKKRYGS